MTAQTDLLTKKSRTIDEKSESSLSGVKIFGTDYPNSVRKIKFSSFQDTWSEGHPYHLLGKGEPSQNIGGAFRTEKRFVTTHLGGSAEDLHELRRFKASSNPASSIVYYGDGCSIPMFPPGTRAGFPPTLSSSEEALCVKGATAIARCKPTKSAASLSQALIELKRDGLPAIPGSRSLKTAEKKRLRDAPSTAADEYLNYVFGIMPLASDIDKLVRASVRANEIWDQYQKDAGKLVRRSYKFPLESTAEKTVSTTASDPWGFATPVYSSYQGPYTVVRHVQRQVWFSGAFTYVLPERTGFAALDKLLLAGEQARKLYGLALDAETLYNVLPWSWLLDWFVNLGDVISNLTSFANQGLVMPYGYIMEHVTVTDVHQLEGVKYAYSDASPNPRTLCLVTETKQRVAASPYGFGISWDSFSLSQLAILAALGISRGGSAVPHTR